MIVGWCPKHMCHWTNTQMPCPMCLMEAKIPVRGTVGDYDMPRPITKAEVKKMHKKIDNLEKLEELWQ